MSKIAYLDNSATTPVDPRVLKVMLPYFSNDFANASSIHFSGQRAMTAVNEARAEISDFIGAETNEVYFSSGATESDNLAIFGLIRAIIKRDTSFKPHVVISTIEHEAVLEPVLQLSKNGLIDFSYLPVDSSGLVDISQLKKLIKAETVLISVMLANNEIGTIQPIKEIGEVIVNLNTKREQRIYFHTDATQAPAYVTCNVKELQVDLLSLSAHKIYGPKGVGCLFIRKGTPIEPLVLGGGQEKKIRSGTYNTAGIVGFAEAVKLLKNKKIKSDETRKVKALRDYVIKEIKKKIPDTLVTGELKARLPNNASFVFKGVEGESVILMLSQQGIMASTGSACSSGSLDPSHVLLAIGLKPENAHGSLRVSLGRFNKKEDVDRLIKHLPVIVEKLRKMSPLKN
jgi:cysteine desulfurase